MIILCIRNIGIVVNFGNLFTFHKQFIKSRKKEKKKWSFCRLQDYSWYWFFGRLLILAKKLTAISFFMWKLNFHFIACQFIFLRDGCEFTVDCQYIINSSFQFLTLSSFPSFPNPIIIHMMWGEGGIITLFFFCCCFFNSSRFINDFMQFFYFSPKFSI